MPRDRGPMPAGGLPDRRRDASPGQASGRRSLPREPGGNGRTRWVSRSTSVSSIGPKLSMSDLLKHLKSLRFVRHPLSRQRTDFQRYLGLCVGRGRSSRGNAIPISMPRKCWPTGGACWCHPVKARPWPATLRYLSDASFSLELGGEPMRVCQAHVLAGMCAGGCLDLCRHVMPAGQDPSEAVRPAAPDRHPLGNPPRPGRRRGWPYTAAEAVSEQPQGGYHSARIFLQGGLASHSSWPRVLKHLDRMSDSTGLIQHAIYNVPRRESGYTTDDNARALCLCVRL